MKKFLLLFAFLFIAGITSAFADSYKWEVSSGSTVFADKNGDTAPTNFKDANLAGATWKLTCSNTIYLGANWSGKNNTWKGLQFGKSKNSALPFSISTDYFTSKTISEIKINASGATTVTLSVRVGDVSFGEKTLENSATSGTIYSFEGIGSGNIEISYSGTTTAAVYLRSIEVTYTEGSLTPTIGWSAENATVYLGDENNKFPTFNNPDNLFIIYDSSDKNVATINDEGNITLVGAGTTTITALDENNIEYTYTLVVERRLDTIFDNNLINNQGDFTIEDIKLGDGLENAWTTNSYGMTANGYVSSKAHEADSWLISPVIDLRYASETTLSFEHGVQYFTDIETAKTETSFNIREENGDWETVTIPYPETLGNNAVSTGAISLAQYEGKKIQLGFHYTSGATKSGRWQIKNVLIQGYIDEPTLPEGGLDFTVENIENDSFVIGKDVESAKITVSGVHAESELYCKFTAAPAENPESAPRKAVDHTGYEKIERDADNNHTITVDGAGTLELYTYHPATDSKSDIRTINVTKEDGTTAIDSIASDVADGEAEYFNLQGVRINPENAAPGLYIRRQGGKAAKVMVK